MFCNVSGIGNVFSASDQQRNHLNSYDILCFSETWSVHDAPSLPSFLSDYNVLVSIAKRDKSRGRASGGLAMLIRKTFSNFNIISKSDLWLCVKIKIFDEIYIICFVYFKPLCDINFNLDSLENLITEIQLENDIETKIIIGGDFNCWIGELNQFDYDDDIFNYSVLSGNRSSVDKVGNKKGRKLVDVLEGLGMLVCNGRSPSDTPANYTFISSIGKSVIDLIWVNQSCICSIVDFKIDNLLEVTDHLCCLLDLNVNQSNQFSNSSSLRSVKTKEILRWNNSCLKSYQSLLSKNNLLYFNSYNVDSLFDNLTSAISQTGLELDMKSVIKYYEKPLSKSGWFDGDCLQAKRDLRLKYRTLKKRGYIDSDLLEYQNALKFYRYVIKTRKQAFSKNVQNSLANVKNSKQFWEVTRRFLKSFSLNYDNLNVADFEEFLKKEYPKRMLCETEFFGCLHPYLDSAITLEELQSSLKSVSLNKAPGVDGISYEFYTNLPPNWVHYVLNLFNSILDIECTPSSWSLTELAMIYKKGDKLNPSNYRGIAKMCTLAKLFTSILASRLSFWADNCNIIPEEQSGFRAGRRCLDNLFSLSSVINMHITRKKKMVFAIFVDFRRAFDSINHNLLWNKLFQLGVSTKLIRIIKGLYEKARLFVGSRGQYSGKVEVTQGVLQGDSLSPLLFALFLSDIVQYFRSNGASGLSINQQEDLLMLLYADDLVILSDSWSDAQYKLKLLKNYCAKNYLEVNASKTNIVVFHRSGRLKEIKGLYLDKQKLERVNNYTYLGVPFSSSGKFLQAYQFFRKKASVAVGKIFRVLIQSRSDSWECTCKLFSAVVEATYLYCAELWAPLYFEQVEIVQTIFLKKLYFLQNSTPNSYIRLETGVVQLKIKIFKSMLKWWLVLLEMPSDRIPSVCFHRLLQADAKDTNGINYAYNWASQLRRLLEGIGANELWVKQDSRDVRKAIPKLLKDFADNCHNKDVENAQLSRYNNTFQHISSLSYGEEYIGYRINIPKIRVIAQVRLSYKKQLKFYYKNTSYTIKCDENCPVCNSEELETLNHVLLACPIYAPLRSHYLAKYGNNLVDILKISSIQHVNDLFHFITGMLRLRSFCIEE